MHNNIIVSIAMCLVYYNIGGLATTNILRLTAGSDIPVNYSKCACDSCGAKISPLLQLPIISFIICRGKCKACGAKIPLFPLFLEIIIFIGMSTISAFFRFSALGVLCSFLFYECIRIAVVMIFGKRENNFAKQYVVAVFSMIVFFVLVEFIALLGSVV